MARCVVALVLLLTLPGCVVRHVASDSDVARFATAWETPRLEMQVALLYVHTQGDAERGAVWADAARTLLDSGRFRPPRPGERPTVRLELTARERRETHIGRVLAGAFILYLWPINVQDRVFEVFVDVRTPSGELTGQVYAQGRGRSDLWLGYLLWPQWIRNGEQRAVIRRDTLKAATVKMCRILVPEKTE